jgi:alkanesulfonate monooxygenase SsuD/methylene tetrahydromethanopterin reductase-like flavin-dependent oxidoreductase (luciferase family)
VHDITGLEGRGVPSVFVASEEFRDAAASQARSLGSTPRGIFVPHPIQDRTDEELEQLADAAFDAIVAAIVS